MISLSSISEEQSSSVSMSDWIAKLQEGKKSTQQLQTDMLNSAIDQIDKIQEEAQKKAEEKREEENKSQNEEAVQLSVSSLNLNVSSSSEVTTDTSTTSSIEVEA